MRTFTNVALLLILMLNLISCAEAPAMDKKSYNKLTADEITVIIHKGTEAPFSGEYNNHYVKGTYVCRQCDAELYHSNDKFDSQCGWPSFDDEIEGAVRRETDADGRRTEILCENCGAHLGHVFNGERLTKKDTRHCVNSLSLKFVAAPPDPNEATAYFAGGCFWGMEYYFQKQEGVISVTSGFMGGTLDNPTYQEVVSGKSGHVEAIEVTYDSSKVIFGDLAKFFFEIHDPTQANGQGPDIGEQYLSVAFYKNDREKGIIEKLIGILKNKGYNIATKTSPASTFWKAEDYHQDYYDKNKQRPYCHGYVKRF
ncbi:MAG: bifunctional methionine sulfoxide reductase B/A protein [Chlorobi bacterium]|nr:bifunctional methionine sulfoxide reductase B/A protein [Chlorobiota bacterium]